MHIMIAESVTGTLTWLSDTSTTQSREPWPGWVSVNFTGSETWTQAQLELASGSLSVQVGTGNFNLKLNIAGELPVVHRDSWGTVTLATRCRGTVTQAGTLASSWWLGGRPRPRSPGQPEAGRGRVTATVPPIGRRPGPAGIFESSAFKFIWKVALYDIIYASDITSR